MTLQPGPIVVVEDDIDDQGLIKELLVEIGVSNQILFFGKGRDAFQYLKSTTEQPFIILSDINLPGQNGVEFKRQIDQDPQLRAKSIPFVFLSTSADKKSVDTVYKEMTVQGFFKKESGYEGLKSVLRLIIDYWKMCKHPNS